MGNCPSSRGQFSPRQDNTVNGSSSGIVINALENDYPDHVDEKIEMDPKAQDATDNVDTSTNGTLNGSKAQEVSIKSLFVEKIDLCISENSNAHRTSNFEVTQRPSSQLVLRRGSAFQMNLILSKAYDSSKDALCLLFLAQGASSLSYSQKTQIIIPVLPVLPNVVHSPNEWYIEKFDTDENKVMMKIVTAADTIIGKWMVEVDSKTKDESEDSISVFKLKDPIIILFNPWCKYDDVYLEKEDLIQEYVMNDSGLMWRGNHKSLRPCVWNYDQFEDNILDCCLYLLSNVGSLSVIKRSNTMCVLKHLSSVLNFSNGNGVFAMDKSNKSKGIQNSTNFCGSQEILQKFYKTKKSQKNPQCWVTAGAFTTVCRTLGIPCRPVTNFGSVQQIQNREIVDCYIDPEGKLLNDLNSETVWSHHTWNEIWMSRTDLGNNIYGGWQAMDVSNKHSIGALQNGPASIAAIKKGENKKFLETESIFSAVNNKKIYWKYNGSKQPLKFIRSSSEDIGNCIATKAVGKYELEDITTQYKFESKSEILMLESLLRESGDSISRCCINNIQEDMHFDLTFPADIAFGETFMVKLTALNKTQEEQQSYTINICLQIHSSLYTGKLEKLVKKDSIETVLEPGDGKEITMKIDCNEYEAFIDHNSFIVSAMATVKETGFDYFSMGYFRLRMPHISIQVDGEIVQNQPLTVSAFFKNPLPKALKNGTFILEGPGFGSPVTIKCKGDIKKDADARITFPMIPKHFGHKIISAKFYSKELTDIEGYHQIFVRKATESVEKAANIHL